MAENLEPLTELQTRDVLGACEGGRRPKLDRALVAVLIDTGARRGEIAGLRALTGVPVPAVLTGDAGNRRPFRLGVTSSLALEELAGRLPPATVFGMLPTAQGVHERILQVGIRAGLSGSLTVRRLRRTWLQTVLNQRLMPDSVLAALADHYPQGITRASFEEAFAAQLGPKWRSPLDELLGSVDRRERTRAA